jgi:DNA-binding NtrC family response regulator
LNSSNHHNNKTIAIVDDDEDIVILFTEVFRENGYYVMAFTNPLHALDYIHEHPDKFDLIILDYRILPMQGDELSNKIHTINSKIKMIIFTVYDNVTNNPLNLEIVKKPIRLSKLLQIIQQHLD